MISGSALYWLDAFTTIFGNEWGTRLPRPNRMRGSLADIQLMPFFGLFNMRNSFGRQLEGRERLYRPCMKLLDGNLGGPAIRGAGVIKIVWQTSKMLIALERKGDLKRLRVKGIIGTCDWLFVNDRCLLLSSANDGKGRCVLLG